MANGFQGLTISIVTPGQPEEYHQYSKGFRGFTIESEPYDYQKYSKGFRGFTIESEPHSFRKMTRGMQGFTVEIELSVPARKVTRNET